MEVNRDYLLIVHNSYTGNEFKEVVVNVLKKLYAVNLPTNSTKDDYERAKANAKVKIKYYLHRNESLPQKRGRPRIYKNNAERMQAYCQRHHIGKKYALPTVKVC